MKTLKNDIYIFRGSATKYNTNNTFKRFVGIQSFSTSPNVASEFTNSQRGCLIRMLVPKGTPVLYIGRKISMFPHEHEVILPPNGIYYKSKQNCDAGIYVKDFHTLNVLGMLTKYDLLPIVYVWSKKSLSKNYKFVKNKTYSKI